MTQAFDDIAASQAFHLTQINDMQRRLIGHIRAGHTTDFADAPMVVDAAIYTDPAQLAREKAEIFAKVPLLACLSVDMPNPGDVMLFEDAGPPILITRDRDGQVHAFLNVCTHRAAKVATRCGHHARLTCRFHAWTFDLKGKLIGIPGKEGFEGLDPSARNLRRVPVAEWQGMIFVRTTPGDEAIDIEAWLGDFAPQLAMLRLGETVPVCQSTLETAANWKLMLDTHGEGYHFASLHAETLAQNIIPNVSVYDLYGPHYRVSFAQKTHGDLAKSDDPYSDITNYSCSMLLFPNTVVFQTTFNLGKQEDAVKVGELDASAFYYGIYRLFPGDEPGRTTTRMATYRPAMPSASLDPGAWEETHRFIEKVLIEEDYAMAAEQYRNLAALAGHDQQAVYGRNEIGIQHFHQEITARTGGLKTP